MSDVRVFTKNMLPNFSISLSWVSATGRVLGMKVIGVRFLNISSLLINLV